MPGCKVHSKAKKILLALYKFLFNKSENFISISFQCLIKNNLEFHQQIFDKNTFFNFVSIHRF